jgi:hypothetical protein
MPRETHFLVNGSLTPARMGALRTAHVVVAIVKGTTTLILFVRKVDIHGSWTRSPALLQQCV